RGHVEDEVAPGDRRRPTVVGVEVARREGQLLSGVRAARLQHRAYVGLAPRRPHGRPHAIAGGQELEDAVRADEARPARHEHSFAAHGAHPTGWPAGSPGRRTRPRRGARFWDARVSRAGRPLSAIGRPAEPKFLPGSAIWPTLSVARYLRMGPRS